MIEGNILSTDAYTSAPFVSLRACNEKGSVYLSKATPSFNLRTLWKTSRKQDKTRSRTEPVKCSLKRKNNNCLWKTRNWGGRRSNSTLASSPTQHVSSSTITSVTHHYRMLSFAGRHRHRPRKPRRGRSSPGAARTLALTIDLNFPARASVSCRFLEVWPLRGNEWNLHFNFLRYHFQPFSLNLVLPSVVKPSGAIAKRGTRHLT